MLDFPNTNITIYAIVSFFIGALAMLTYYKVKSQFKQSNAANLEVIDTIVSQYKRRMDKHEAVINELKNQIDLLESKINEADGNTLTNNHGTSDSTSQQISRYSGEHTVPVSNRVIIGFNDIKETESGEYSHTGDTPEIILRLLLNGPLTSRDIQKGIGRTREHTSRVMKKLYELRYVDRDINHKPFMYNITDLGRLQVKPYLD